MKKRVSLYLAVITTLFSLQSCVSNYVVSKSTVYKTDAKLASLPIKKADEPKAAAPSAQIKIALASLEAGNKRAEIEKTINREKKIDNLLAEADSYLGTPYRFGGTSRNGIDCSAFVLSVFGAAANISLPRVAASQALEGENVDRWSLQRGDLIFFSQGRGRISHVAIVYEVTADGEVKFIHSASSKGVSFSSLSSSYWSPKFRFAKRVLNDNNFYNDAPVASLN